MNNHQTKRRFSTEFKLEAITQVITHRQRVPDVGRSLCGLEKVITGVAYVHSQFCTYAHFLRRRILQTGPGR
ncbi:hypothetical protein C6H64_20915 [Photorhabdus luminescens]|nr:hypothetical protein C6H64_20915 [Photorhabdus luminescens]PQQ31823.1 hypothetical protein C6H69_14820 [Photorhabdus luminescens]